MLKNILSVFTISLASTLAFADSAYHGPDGYLSKAANQKLWSKYCVGTAASADIPEVNYKNTDVREAASRLSQVADLSFYFYSGIVKAYGLRDGKELIDPPKKAPKGTTPQAHAFLTLLCGEFRDRATMIEAKLNWVKNLYLLPTTKQEEIDPKENIWSQMSARSYAPYLDFSRELHEAKADARDDKSVKFGSYAADTPVDGQTVCEAKYILSQYVAKGRKFKDLESFNKGLNSFTGKYCSDDEINSYYVFRGDSNFKPNSPESNGMIWYSLSIGNHCSDTETAADDSVTNSDCKQYFSHPFRNRWDGARAGLGAWLLYHPKFKKLFSSEEKNITIVPHHTPAISPFSYRVGSTVYREFREDWDSESYSQEDMGFNAFTGLGKEGLHRDIPYELLRDAVNRHTDWYHSGFDDGIGLSRNQAYSPFQASSYEMSASDNFTSPGATVKSPKDGKKHWMFIFRVKKENWYNSATLAAGKKVDFDRMWFDETSLGTNSLAKSERAWDRLGEALEDEYEAILYLHNITEDGEVRGE